LTDPLVANLPTLETRRLRLRALGAGDVPALFGVFSDPQTMRYWSRPAMRNPSEAEELLREIGRLAASRTLFQWGLALREDDVVIGTCTLAWLDWTHRRAELGYALGSPHWRRGFMGEALPALIEHAFGALALRRLEADVDPRNEPSLRLLDKLGFKREGYLRERYDVNGELQDTALFGLLARERAAG
jgi:RimJ/RimL family protein N-acetyltransferase